jgi:RNA polymerase sigma factor (sigma-70 family)
MEHDKTLSAGTSVALLERYRAGDVTAAEALFSRYFQRLTSLARSRLSPRLARRTDPEDVVLSVFRSFFIDARAGRFSLRRGGDLWRLLASITKHKLLRQARYHSADRRSVDLELPLDPAEDDSYCIRAQEPRMEDAVALADELECVFTKLDPLGKRVLELRLQGAQLSEIAQDTGRSERTVRRALGRVREVLAEQLGDASRELRDESALPRGTSFVAAGPKAPVAEIGQSVGVPLLSHHDVLLRRMIGSGRTGKVYEAWQPSAGRTVAVKFLRKSLLHHRGVVRRFVAEAGIIARLQHPNIVGIHGLGQAPAGAHFIVMQLISGSNLDLIARAGPIAVAEAIRWSIETCSALEYAHSRGIMHCDLKPANILLDHDSSIRVTDFGLARSLAGPTPWTTEVEGTAPFMAPEQASRSWGPLGVRTDVYGVGAVLFTLLTGRPPWIGRRLPDILADVISAAPVIPPKSLRADLPESVTEVCLKCLSKTPEGRYPTIQDVRSALIKIIA